MYLLNIIQITIFFLLLLCIYALISKCVYVCLFVRTSSRFFLLYCCCCCDTTCEEQKKGIEIEEKKIIKKFIIYVYNDWLCVEFVPLKLWFMYQIKYFLYFLCFLKPSFFLHLNGFIFFLCCMLRITVQVSLFFSQKYRHIFRQTFSFTTPHFFQITEVTRNVQ